MRRTMCRPGACGKMVGWRVLVRSLTTHNASPRGSAIRTIRPPCPRAPSPCPSPLRPNRPGRLLRTAEMRSAVRDLQHQRRHHCRRHVPGPYLPSRRAAPHVSSSVQGRRPGRGRGRSGFCLPRAHPLALSDRPPILVAPLYVPRCISELSRWAEARSTTSRCHGDTVWRRFSRPLRIAPDLLLLPANVGRERASSHHRGWLRHHDLGRQPQRCGRWECTIPVMRALVLTGPLACGARRLALLCG